jgi:uncharacterized membrane protein YdjX (TVP38/TMEM64 family)
MKAKLAWGVALLSLVALLALLALLALWASWAEHFLPVAMAWAGQYKCFVQTHPVPCWLGMLACGAVAINSPLPLAALIKVLTGYFFGLEAGFTLNVGISVSGGLVGFMASRHLFHRALYKRFGHQLARANLEIARNGFWYVLSARLLVAAPFFLVNVLAGLSSMRKRKFLLGTLLGVLPSSMLYAMSGSQLETIRSVSDLANPRMAVILALVAAAVVVPALIKRKKRKCA